MPSRPQPPAGWEGTRSRRWARAVSSVRRAALSLARRLEECGVYGAVADEEAGTDLAVSDRPSATRASTSRSRGVRRNGLLGVGRIGGGGAELLAAPGHIGGQRGEVGGPDPVGDRVRAVETEDVRVRGRPRASRASAPRIRAYAARYGSGAASHASATPEPVLRRCPRLRLAPPRTPTFGLVGSRRSGSPGRRWRRARPRTWTSQGVERPPQRRPPAARGEDLLGLSALIAAANSGKAYVRVPRRPAAGGRWRPAERDEARRARSAPRPAR